MRLTADDTDLRGITLFGIRTYLQSRGWVSARHPNTKWVVFQGPMADSGNRLQIILPRKSEFSDFYLRIADAVNLLAAIEDSLPRKVVNDIKSYDADTIRFRVMDTGAQDIVPLSEAARDVAALRNLFAYGACSEGDPRPHFDALTSYGTKHADACLFDHTFRGSFGFSVRSPLLGENEQQDIMELPFERRVVERVVRGLTSLERAVSSHDYDVVVAAYPEAFNSRMCDALGEFHKESNRQLEVSVSWAAIVPPSPDVAEFRSITLSDKYFECLAYAAERLREVEPEQIDLLGHVVNLHSNTVPDVHEKEGTVTVKYQHHESGNLIDVRLRLSRPQYVEAARAHIEGKLVRALGILEKRGTVWDLVGITQFEVVGGSNNGIEPTR